jgi:hypothetical protein
MTGLESKIKEFIETAYKAKFLGDVKVEIDGNEYCLKLVLNNYMIPLTIYSQNDSEEDFYKFITKELGTRNLVRVDYLQLKKIE